MAHILWDWNGTLLDDVVPCVRAINAILRRRRLPRVTIRRYREVFCFPVRRYYEMIGLRPTEDEWARIAVEFHEFYRLFSAAAPLRPGVLDALRHMRRRGWTLSILSASEITLLERMVRERRIRGYFARLAGLRDYYAHSKIDLGRELLAASGGDPAEAVLIGDTLHDYEVAQEIGCRCILVAGGHQTETRLRTSGAPVIRDFRGLPAALRCITPTCFGRRASRERRVVSVSDTQQVPATKGWRP